MNRPQRRDSLVQSMAEQRLDALLVSARPNIQYLTGFSGSSGLLVLSAGTEVLFTDPRYDIQAGQQADCKVRICRSSLAKAAVTAIRRARWRRVGFEAARSAYGAYHFLRDSLPARTEADA